MNQTKQNPPPPSGIWLQDFYRVRKKVLTIGEKYWIEDRQGNTIGFSKQKLFKLKEDIRIYTDEKAERELFKIQQKQILDLWGTFMIMDSNTDRILGYIKRKALTSSFAWDEWDVYDSNDRLIGGIHESKSLGLLRKYMPGGTLIPERMTLKLGGTPVANIDQKFKIIGDIWELECTNLPPNFDRRVLLGGLILMAKIERKNK